ncbi:helix-turn-helix domain-containing protein [Fodinicurvata halophila]
MPEIRPLRILEQEAVLRAIEHCDGNVPRAAALLEVNPSTLYRKLQSWRANAD